MRGDDMRHLPLRSLVGAALLTGIIVTGASAAPPVVETETWTLEMALAELAIDPEAHDGDCGSFVLVVDYTVARRTITQPDGDVIRHVSYTGNIYNASDTSESLPRSGTFMILLDFEGESLQRIVRSGLFEWVEVDGHRVPTQVGRYSVTFGSDGVEVASTPRFTNEPPAWLCEALAGSSS